MTTTRPTRTSVSRNKVNGESSSSAIVINDEISTNSTSPKAISKITAKKLLNKKPISSSAKR